MQKLEYNPLSLSVSDKYCCNSLTLAPDTRILLQNNKLCLLIVIGPTLYLRVVDQPPQQDHLLRLKSHGDQSLRHAI